MNLNTRLRLSVMMFVQYFIWGAWYATLSSYLTKINFTGNDIGRAYSTTALAAIVSPFFVGMIADRFFSAEKVLAVLHLVGAGLLFYVSTIKDPMTFYYVLLAYTLCYMPTLALTNSLSFDHMKDPSKDFPSIRVMGTIAWITVGWILAKLEFGDKALSLQLGAGASLLMGLYCFTLPHTPPKSAGKAVKVRDILGLDALGLMKDPSFLFFVIGS
ncbi:MAG TPA: MFS transporter, partial [Candidatus Sumerlaeota bacterium]|nr:MFS transporter [Candidatus Sumerlaeota bacterium]